MNLDSAVAVACRHGAITYSDLRRLGVSRSAIAYRVRTGQWFRPHREIYVVKSLVVDRTRSLAEAAILASPIDAFLSHAAATHVYGIQGVPRERLVDVTLPPTIGHRAIQGIRVHRSDVAEPLMRNGLPIVSAEHALRGLADQVSLPALLSAMDSALHLGLVTKDSLLAVPQPRLLVARTTWFRALELADGRAESPLESRARLVVIEAGLGPVDLQIEVEVDGVVYRIDIGWRWGPLGLEADGRDAHNTAEAVLNDRRRQNALFGAGWPLVRCAWEDVTGPPDKLLRDIRQAMAEQRRRHAA